MWCPDGRARMRTCASLHRDGAARIHAFDNQEQGESLVSTITSLYMESHQYSFNIACPLILSWRPGTGTDCIFTIAAKVV